MKSKADSVNAPRDPQGPHGTDGPPAVGAVFFSPISVYLATPVDVLWLMPLQAASSNELGFLTRRALREYIDAQCVWLAAIGPHVAGYCISPRPRRRPPSESIRSIWQVVTAKEFRRLGVATELVARVVADSHVRGFVGLEARCAAPLAANNFWRCCDFKPIAHLPAANARKREIICWRRPLGKIPLWFLDPSQRKAPR